MGYQFVLYNHILRHPVEAYNFEMFLFTTLCKSIQVYVHKPGNVARHPTVGLQ